MERRRYAFSTLVKNELAHLAPKKACCRRAELSAILHLDGSLHIHSGHIYGLSTSTENAAVGRLCIKLMSGLFGLSSELEVRRVALGHANEYVITAPPQPKLVPALKELGILGENTRIEYGISNALVKSRCCKAAYVRGAFLAGGFLSEPHGNYHFEISTNNARLAEHLKDLMRKLDLPARISARVRNYAVYLKEGEQIFDFLALVGAHDALLKWEDVRILKEMRSQVNRLVNCDTANLNKAIEAALGQLQDINLIEEEVGLRKLPPSLRQIAEARLRAPHASLRELGEMVDPPLSKSAVNHRVRRLTSLAVRLRARAGSG